MVLGTFPHVQLKYNRNPDIITILVVSCLDIRSRVPAGLWKNTGQDVESVPHLPQPNSQQKGRFFQKWIEEESMAKFTKPLMLFYFFIYYTIYIYIITRNCRLVSRL